MKNVFSYFRSEESSSLARKRATRVFLRRANILLVTLIISLTSGFLLWKWRAGELPGYARLAEEKVIVFSSIVGMNLEHIYLEGQTHVEPAEVRDALGLYLHQPLLTIPPGEVKINVEKIGWVERADVQRQFPNALHIHITERVPFSIWQHKGVIRLIDRHGQIISRGDVGDYWHLPIIVGEDAHLSADEIYELISSEESLRDRVSAVIRVGMRRWSVQLDNGIKVKLPENDPISAWNYLAQLHRKKQLLDRDISMVDLRVPDRLFIQVN